MKFRRKTSASAEPVGAPSTGTPDSTDSAPDPQAAGPYDVADVDLDDLDGPTRIDLGSLLLIPTDGREVRLQVDEKTKEIQSVLIAGPDGALELRAFAAARNADLWAQVRPQVVADVVGRGGKTAEREGRFGTELLCERPVQLPDGTSQVQPQRIIGVNGPRWFLRATLLGAPARSAQAGKSWEDMLALVVVRRGTGAMPPGDVLPVALPDQARRLD